MRNIHYTFVAVCLLAVGFAACKDTDTPGKPPAEVDNSLTVAPEKLHFVVAGETKVAAVTSKLAWTTNTEEEWLTIVETEGEFSVTATANETADARTGSITVDNGKNTATVTITQDAVENTALSLDTKNLSFTVAGETKTIAVTSALPWTAESAESWLEIVELENSFTVKATSPADSAPRYGSVTVTNGTETINVNVVQAIGAEVMTAGNGVYDTNAYYGADVTNYLLQFQGDGDYTDLGIRLNVISMLADFSRPILDLSEGIYPFFIGDGANAEANTIDMAYSTEMWWNNGYYHATDTEYTITSGEMTVSGNHRGYIIAIKMTLSNGEVFNGIFNGSLNIDNPDIGTTFEENQDLGTMPIVDMLYFGNAYPEYSADAFPLQAYSEGISVEQNMYLGSGWVIATQLHTTMMNNNGKPIPDGVYNIAQDFSVGTALAGGYEPVHGNRAGSWVLLIEEGVIVGEAPLMTGTVTSAYSDGQYTIIVDAFDELGNNIACTLVGAGTVAIPPASGTQRSLFLP